MILSTQFISNGDIYQVIAYDTTILLTRHWPDGRGWSTIREFDGLCPAHAWLPQATIMAPALDSHPRLWKPEIIALVTQSRELGF